MNKYFDREKAVDSNEILRKNNFVNTQNHSVSHSPMKKRLENGASGDTNASFNGIGARVDTGLS
jgi:hypothetical protein